MLVTDRGAERVRPTTWEVKTRVALKSYLNFIFAKGLTSDKEIGVECILNAEWLVQWLQWMLSGAGLGAWGRGVGGVRCGVGPGYFGYELAWFHACR
jgi:hypothetical protein